MTKLLEAKSSQGANSIIKYEKTFTAQLLMTFCRFLITLTLYDYDVLLHACRRDLFTFLGGDV